MLSAPNLSEDSAHLRKSNLKLTASFFIALLLCAQASSQEYRVHATRTVVRTAQANNDEETFVVARDANGKTVCRNANTQEHERITSRNRNDKFKLIYGGAPVKSKTSLSATTWTDPTTGLTLLPSAGLHIVLHATTQLDQNTAAKNAFIVAANRWEAIISTSITVVIDVDFGTTFFGTPFGSSSILGQTGSRAVTNPYTSVR